MQAETMTTQTTGPAAKYVRVVRVSESIERASFACDGVKVK